MIENVYLAQLFGIKSWLYITVQFCVRIGQWAKILTVGPILSYMRKYSDQTMSLELMTRRLTYSVRLSPAYCQFLRLGLDLSRYELPRPVKLYLPPPRTNGVSFGKIGTQETYFKTTFQRQFIAKRQRAKTATTGHCRWADVSSTRATWSGRSASSCNLEWVPRWGSWPTGCPHWRRWDLHPFGTLLLVQRGKMFFCDSAGSGVKILICRIRIQSKMDRIRNPGQKSFKC
jgi:hypothetical protein